MNILYSLLLFMIKGLIIDTKGNIDRRQIDRDGVSMLETVRDDCNHVVGMHIAHGTVRDVTTVHAVGQRSLWLTHNAGRN